MTNYVINEANTVQQVCIVRTTADAPSEDVDINLQTQPFTATGTLSLLLQHLPLTCMGLYRASMT